MRVHPTIWDRGLGRHHQTRSTCRRRHEEKRNAPGRVSTQQRWWRTGREDAKAHVGARNRSTRHTRESLTSVSGTSSTPRRPALAPTGPCRMRRARRHRCHGRALARPRRVARAARRRALRRRRMVLSGHPRRSAPSRLPPPQQPSWPSSLIRVTRNPLAFQ